MVAIVGGPAERQFRQIAGTHHKTIGLVGNVHQNLRAFARLCVLVRDIAEGCVVIYVGKMLHYGFSDVYFAQCDAKCLHEANCIVVCAIGCAESGHCDPDNSTSIQAEKIKRAGADQ